MKTNYTPQKTLFSKLPPMNYRTEPTARPTAPKQNDPDSITPTAFSSLLREWERVADSSSEIEKSNALYNLAFACALSVVKKIIGVSAQNAMYDIRTDIYEARKHFSKLENILENSTALKFNASGDLVSVVLDESLVKSFDRVMRETLGDGFDLVNDAVLAILAETEKVPHMPLFMESTYTDRKLSKRVRITDNTSLAWSDVECTPIQEVFKHIRRCVTASASVQIASFKYAYISDVLRDSVSGEEETIYERLPLYCDLLGEETDSNGKVIALTADEHTVHTYYSIVNSLNLTDRQATVLKYRMKGHGSKAIATALNIDPRLVKRCIKQIQVKMYDMGIYPNGYTRPTTVK